MNATDGFKCSICGEQSSTICAYCTHDACGNHLCEKCKRCSDCCACAARFQTDDPTEHRDLMPAALSGVPDSSLNFGGVDL